MFIADYGNLRFNFVILFFLEWSWNGFGTFWELFGKDMGRSPAFLLSLKFFVWSV